MHKLFTLPKTSADSPLSAPIFTWAITGLVLVIRSIVNGQSIEITAVLSGSQMPSILAVSAILLTVYFLTFVTAIISTLMMPGGKGRRYGLIPMDDDDEYGEEMRD